MLLEWYITDDLAGLSAEEFDAERILPEDEAMREIMSHAERFAAEITARNPSVMQARLLRGFTEHFAALKQLL